MKIVPSVLMALFSFYLPQLAFSQCGTAPTSGTTTVNTSGSIRNTYYPGTGNPTAGSSSLTVGARDARGNATDIANGDLVLIIQMQGADINSTNTDSYGDGVSGGSASGYLTTNLVAGTYEYNIVNSYNSGTGLVQFTHSLANNYYTRAYTSSTGTQSYQLIRVAWSYDFTINSGKSLTAPAWNGSTGGVVVIEAAHTFTINGTITVDGLGFRGGGGKQLTGATAGNTNGSGSITNTDYRWNSAATTSANKTGGAKGEGIAGTPMYTLDNGNTTTTTNTLEGYINGSEGRGAPGNAGGGGTDGDPSANQYNTGGGGGGNGGAGGQGGSGWDGGTGNPATYPYGGHGGSAFAQASLSRFVMGGGGGAGSSNNSSGTTEYLASGAEGGGIILIRAKFYAGSGVLSANGATAYDQSTSGVTDAAGGGGGGGTIVMVTNTTTAPGANTITATATGGNGGNMTAWYAHGPGGGGGGGVVITNVLASGSITVTAGTHGLTRTGSSSGPINNTYGSASGSNGVAKILSYTPILYSSASGTSACGILPVTIEAWTGVYRNDKSYLSWTTTSVTDFAYFVVERSTDGTNFVPLGQVAVAANGAANATYSYTDMLPSKGVNYYRLKMVDNNGQYRYSGLITIRSEVKGFNVTASPNPFTDHVSITIESSTDEVIHLRLFTSDGKQVWHKTSTVSAGTNVQYYNDFQSLAPGVYFIKVNRANSSNSIKLLKQ